MKIEVVQGNVAGITYFPAAKDSHLRYPDNRQKPPELFSPGEPTAKREKAARQLHAEVEVAERYRLDQGQPRR